MKVPNATDALRQQAEALRRQAETQTAELTEVRNRRPDLEAGIKPGSSWANIPEPTREVYERLRREQNEAYQKLNTAIAETRRLQAPLEGLLRYLDGLKPVAEINSRIDVEIQTRQWLLQSAATVRKMVDAGGPELAKQFPLAQLELIEKSLRDEVGELQKKSPPKPAPAQQVGGWGAPAVVSKDPVLLTLAKVPDLASAAKAIAEQLQTPALEGAITAAAAKVKGADAERFASAMRGFALLADYALGTPDWKAVGPQMTFGSPGCDRTDHRARAYDQRVLGASRTRQQLSRETLAAGLETALVKGAGGVEAALSQQLFRELGLNERETAAWRPTLPAMLAALDGEAFTPLRALIELIPNHFCGRYPAPDIEAMRSSVRQIAQAVVEGRYPDSRLDLPENIAQLALLPREAQRTAWLGGFGIEGTGNKGQKVTTHEAEGLENFWATKIGGPSHGFENMSHCTLSILGNVRTKAIVVDDANWHQPVARAYIRLLGNDQGRPMLYVEDPQYDFRVRNAKEFDPDAIRDRVVEHAVSRAKELGTDLVVSDLLLPSLKRLGIQSSRYDGMIVLEPSAVRAEASDSMLGHDCPQPSRMVTRSRLPFVAVALQ